MNKNNNNQDTNNKNVNVNKNINHYQPDQERCCRGCYKTFKTKEGILEHEYKFACGSCHNWYKKRDWAGIGIGLTIFCLFFYLIIRKRD